MSDGAQWEANPTNPIEDIERAIDKIYKSTGMPYTLTLEQVQDRLAFDMALKIAEHQERNPPEI